MSSRARRRKRKRGKKRGGIGGFLTNHSRWASYHARGAKDHCLTRLDRWAFQEKSADLLDPPPGGEGREGLKGKRNTQALSLEMLPGRQMRGVHAPEEQLRSKIEDLQGNLPRERADRVRSFTVAFGKGGYEKSVEKEKHAAGRRDGESRSDLWPLL